MISNIIFNLFFLLLVCLYIIYLLNVYLDSLIVVKDILFNTVAINTVCVHILFILYITSFKT